VMPDLGWGVAPKRFDALGIQGRKVLDRSHRVVRVGGRCLLHQLAPVCALRIGRVCTKEYLPGYRYMPSYASLPRL
jgi:hypothetical protein